MAVKRTVRQSLQYVADYPQPVNDELILMHTGELVARTLYDIANKPDVNVRGSLSRANKARKMIMDRLDGTRRPGTAPQRHEVDVLHMRDLTGREVTSDGD